MSKFKSRKFWICVAACMMSVYLTTRDFDNPHFQMVGTICFVLSSAIYAGAEALVDATAKREGK